jgi:hypothetical protein
MELVLLLGSGADALLPGQPALEIRLEQLGFQVRSSWSRKSR